MKQCIAIIESWQLCADCNYVRCTISLLFVMVECFVVQNLPRFTGENLTKNEELRERVQRIADRKKCSLNQLALAWLHHKGKDIVPLPGNNVKTINFYWTTQDTLIGYLFFPTSTLHLGYKTHNISTRWSANPNRGCSNCPHCFWELVWISNSSSKWGFSCSLNGHIFPFDYVDYCVQNGYQTLNMQSNLF